MSNLAIVLPPDLEAETEEYAIVTWLKRPGDPVRKGETLVIVQAEKVSFELPAPADGKLTEILVPQGAVVKSGEVLARVDAVEAPVESEVDASSTLPAPPAAPTSLRASPIAKRLAREHGIDLTQVQASGTGGRITEKDVRAVIDARSVAQTEAPPATSKPVRASPVAKRLAREQGIDLTQVQGSGAGGRITEKDIRTFMAAGVDASPSVPDTQAAGEEIQETDDSRPLAGMRAAIARRMHASLQEMAQLTLFTEADVTELVDLRQRLKAAAPETAPVTYTDLLMRAAALALRQHPNVNVTLEGGRIHRLPHIHIGLAVGLVDGLVVPVLRDADRKTPAELARLRVRLVERARSGQLTNEEMSGGTFTVTNLGMFDIDGFTPIINPPEAAILGVGRVVEKVVVHRGKIAQRSMMTLSLTIDHRLVDGAPGAAFLQTVKGLLEEPDRLVEGA